MFELRARSLALAGLVAAGVAGLAVPAWPQDGDDLVTIARRWFERNDLDKNGALTAAEIESGRDKQFRRIDIDGDGRISLDEFSYGLRDNRPVQAAWLEYEFAHMDADRDGYVSAAEFIGYGARLIAVADANGNGQVTLEEYLAAMLQ